MLRMRENHFVDGPTCFGIATPAIRYTASRPARDRQYLAFIRRLPCLVCATRRRVEAAHFGPHGIAQKASDYSAIPLCHNHHRGYRDSLHQLGPVRFQEQHGLDIPAFIVQFNQFYETKLRRKAA
jgi:hypothetical protein